MKYDRILDHLPYKSLFRLVDEISALDENGVIGHYTLKEDAFFYADHFPGNPVTPGAIIIEIMAQTGLVVLGIHLLMQEAGGQDAASRPDTFFPLLTSAEVIFLKMALPGQRLTVRSQKQYFRWGKLKCRVEVVDETGEAIAKGILSGVMHKMDKK